MWLVVRLAVVRLVEVRLVVLRLAVLKSDFGSERVKEYKIIVREAIVRINNDWDCLLFWLVWVQGDV
jgi:hypothetical protein